MKQRRRTKIFGITAALFCWALVAGCSATATDTPGVFVSNVEGTYDLAVITNSITCTPYFDSVVTVVQADDRFTILAENAGFDDLLGVFDEGEESIYTLAGAGKDCTGNFVDGLLTNICNITLTSCITDESTGEETCTEQDFSCQLTYERR